MNVHNFLSTTDYLILPTKSNPKVYLPIGDSEQAALAFELYNPFSKKARFLKSIVRVLTVKLNPIAKVLLPTQKGQSSSFVLSLEKTLGEKLTTSVYVATEKDKLVLQLQNKDKILGYLKYPISELGKKRLTNEAKAISIVSKKKLVPPLLLSAMQEEPPFIILQNLAGDIGQLSKQEYSDVLNQLKKENAFKLTEHPRVIGLQNRLAEHRYEALKISFNKAIKRSGKKYQEVFEHGDFAPWNLIKTNTGVVPFDFEYFEEAGLEHLDEIKYHFQEQHLLYHKNGKQLIEAISKSMALDEFDILFQIYLVKEILNKKDSQESYAFENSLLNLTTNDTSDGL